MPDASRLDKVFAQLLCHHAYGWAMLKKVTARDMHPGSCGYFDSEGDWQNLVDLTRPSPDLLSDGWKTPDARIQDEKAPEALTWGPKTSRAVHASQLGGAVGSTHVFCHAFVAPVEASITLSFQSTNDQCAILAAESPVWRYRVGDETAALQWMTDNAPVMLQRHNAVMKRHGVWLITKTYTSRRCAVAMMGGKTCCISIGLGASVPGILTLTPTSTWTRGQGDCSTEVHEDEEGVVAFMSGIYFRKKLLGGKLKSARNSSGQRGQIFRGVLVAPDESELDGEVELELEVQYPDEQTFA